MLTKYVTLFLTPCITFESRTGSESNVFVSRILGLDSYLAKLRMTLPLQSIY